MQRSYHAFSGISVGDLLRMDLRSRPVHRVTSPAERLRSVTPTRQWRRVRHQLRAATTHTTDDTRTSYRQHRNTMDADTERIFHAAGHVSVATHCSSPSWAHLMSFARDCTPAQAKLNEELSHEEFIWLLEVHSGKTGAYGRSRKREKRERKFFEKVSEAEEVARKGRLEIVKTVSGAR